MRPLYDLDFKVIIFTILENKIALRFVPSKFDQTTTSCWLQLDYTLNYCIIESRYVPSKFDQTATNYWL
jgi:hypothetical protein